MTSQNKNNISARWMTYGIAVRGSEASGWKITGKSKELLTEECFKLVKDTSGGQASESWAKVFEDGYGYFGERNNEAVFAHFYRSLEISDRGRYFVPRTILLIPFQEYVDKLHCNHRIVFEELKKRKGISPVNLGDEPDILESMEIPVPESAYQPPLELLQLEKIDGGFLIDFLTCILQPGTSDIIIWGEMKPDTELFFLLLLLLPKTLRKFITFCTCVEDPKNANTRIKIVKNLPDNFENSSLIIMKDNEMAVRKKTVQLETAVPGIFVNAFRKNIDSLTSLHHLIDIEIGSENALNFEAALEQTGSFLHDHNQKEQINGEANIEEKYKKLTTHYPQLRIPEADRDYVLAQVKKGLSEISGEKIREVQQELGDLLQKLGPLNPIEIESLIKIFWELTGKSHLGEFLPLLKTYLSIIQLKEAVMPQLFEKLKLKTTPEWNEVLEVLSLIQNKFQYLQLNENKELLNQLENHKEAGLFFLLLDLIFVREEPSEEFFDSIADKIAQLKEVDVYRILDVLFYGFEYFEKVKKEKLKLLFFLLLAAYTYPYISELPQKEKEKFETLFIKSFSHAIFLENREKADAAIDRLLEKIESVNEEFGKRLAAILNRRTLVDYLGSVTNLLDNEEILPIGGINEVAELFRSLENFNSKTGQPSNLVPTFFDLAFHFNAIPSDILFSGYISYLQEKQNLQEKDFQILIGALTKNSSPLKSPDFLPVILLFVIERCNGARLIKYVQILLILAKLFFEENNKDRSVIGHRFVEMLQDHWKPSGINEIREIYKSVSSCFDKTTAEKVLMTGLSKCFKEEKASYLVQVLREIFDEFAIVSTEQENPYKMILNNIDITKSKDDSFAMSIQNYLEEINERQEDYEDAIDKIEELLKKIKKVK